MASIARLPKPLMDVYEWQYEGKCRQVDPESFFSPEAERGPRRRSREAKAKAVCAVCPVVSKCLEHALAVREPYGVWGGLNPTERGNPFGSGRRQLTVRLGPKDPVRRARAGTHWTYDDPSPSFDH